MTFGFILVWDLVSCWVRLKRGKGRARGRAGGRGGRAGRRGNHCTATSALPFNGRTVRGVPGMIYDGLDTSPGTELDWTELG